MAKFRRNHQRKGLGINLGKVLLFAVVLVAALIFCFRNIESIFQTPDGASLANHIPPDERYFLPKGSDGQVIHHNHFSLSYLEKYEQAEWVAYDLSVQELNMPKFKRYKRFNPDYSVKTRSSFHRDYSRSGYTRGHLAPAADMAFDSLAMKQSFYMSNISPQTRTFNNGVWRELEEQVRDWGRKYQHIYVVTGPIFKEILGHIGENRVAVPGHFYKVILDIRDPEKKAIGFIIPNETTDKPLQYFARSIDEVEQETGLDFYGDLISPSIEQKLERELDINLWIFDDRRYQKRVNQWNHQK